MTMATDAPTTQVYQLYIRATAEQVWQAITDPAVVGRYFHGALVEGTYEVGTVITKRSPDGSALWSRNTVLESDPPRRLVHTWRSLYDDELAGEPESRVTWEVEEQGDGLTRLTLVHDRLDHSPKTAASVRGWPYILSSLKSVLETGEPLPRGPRDTTEIVEPVETPDRSSGPPRPSHGDRSAS
jgi:uncharacterized protein YndB with AHSA1/START domain